MQVHVPGTGSWRVHTFQRLRAPSVAMGHNPTESAQTVRVQMNGHELEGPLAEGPPWPSTGTTHLLRSFLLL